MSENGTPLNWIGPVVIVAAGVLLRLTDRLWLVDWFDAPSLSEGGNIALGIAVGAAWYTLPLLLVGISLVFGARDRMATPALWLFGILGALAVAALPNRHDGAYNLALDDRVPGLTNGMIIGTIPLFFVGAVIWVANRVVSRSG
jgi:hypothetical protein